MTSPENFAVASKYELETVPIGIGGKRLTLYRVGNWEPFIEKIFSGDKGALTDFPHWIKIWEASLVLTDYLLEKGLSPGKSVLEIGAGMGVTGMFLAAFGHRVTITDSDEDCLDLLRLNTAHNGLTNTEVRKLYWGKGDLTGTFDLICGTEVIYREEVITPLIALLRKHLSPGGQIFLAHDRQRKNVEKFISRLPADAEVESIGKTFRGKDTAHRIVIHTLRFASS